MEELNQKLIGVKDKLSKLKRERDKADRKHMQLKQETGIVSQQSLSNDHKKRERMNAQLLEEIVTLKAHHKELKR